MSTKALAVVLAATFAAFGAFAQLAPAAQRTLSRVVPDPPKPEPAPIPTGEAVLIQFQISQDTGNYQLGACSESGLCSPGHEVVDSYPIICGVTAQRAYCEVPWSLPSWVKAAASSGEPVACRLVGKSLVFQRTGAKSWKLKFISRNPETNELDRRAEAEAAEAVRMKREAQFAAEQERQEIH